MAIGIVGGGSSRYNAHIDYDVTITASTDGVSNWQKDETAGTNCYVQTVLTADISRNLYVDGNTDFQVIPHPEKITEWALDQFGWIGAAESTATGIKFYCFIGQPSFDIPITLRIIK